VRQIKIQSQPHPNHEPHHCVQHPKIHTAIYTRSFNRIQSSGLSQSSLNRVFPTQSSFLSTASISNLKNSLARINRAMVNPNLHTFIVSKTPHHIQNKNYSRLPNASPRPQPKRLTRIKLILAVLLNPSLRPEHRRLLEIPRRSRSRERVGGYPSLHQFTNVSNLLLSTRRQIEERRNANSPPPANDNPPHYPLPSEQPYSVATAPVP